MKDKIEKILIIILAIFMVWLVGSYLEFIFGDIKEVNDFSQFNLVRILFNAALFLWRLFS